MADEGDEETKAGSGFIPSKGRHVLVLIIISVLIYFFDVLTDFQRSRNPFSDPSFLAYLIFVIVIVLVFKLSWQMDDREIGMFVGIYLGVWVFPSIKSIASFIPDWAFVLAGLFGPFYFIAILPHEKTKTEKVIVFVFVFLLVFFFIDSISEAAETKLGAESTQVARVNTVDVLGKALLKIKEGPAKFKEWISNIATVTKKSWERQVAFAAGDYYTGTVDQNAKEKLGVYIEDIKLSEPVVYEGEPVSVWGVMKARTLGDKIINVKVSCKTKDQKGNEIKGYSQIGQDEKSREFEIAKMEEEDIDCNFEKYQLKVGTYNIKFNAIFNFTTMAYLKAYFINKDRLRSLVREDIDVFDYYGITDKEPKAIYTNGPIMIGMETSKPPIGLSTDYDNKPRLGITIDNQWEGKVRKIKDIIIYIPEGVGMGGCMNSFKIYDSINDEEKQEGYDAYNLNDDVKEDLRFKNIENFITENCVLNIPQYSVNNFLGKTPITTKYFKVTVEYEYELEKGISVSVIEPKGFNVRIKQTNPTSGVSLICYGKHPDKKIKSAECSFYEVTESGSERVIEEKAETVCPESKECTCTLSKEKTRKGQIVKCKMTAIPEKPEENEDEKMIDSDSVTIANSPPEIEGEININDGNKVVVNNDLICTAIISDNDGDPITATYKFEGDYEETIKVEGCESYHLEGKGGSSYKCSATVEGYKIIKGASISCKVVPNDGTTNGKGKTKTITVQGAGE